MIAVQNSGRKRVIEWCCPLKLFPAMNSGEPNVSMRSSHKFLADPQKSNHKVGGDSCTWRNDSEIQNNCPARFENKTTIREDDSFLDVLCKPNPWTVQQTDEREVNEVSFLIFFLLDAVVIDTEIIFCGVGRLKSMMSTIIHTYDSYKQLWTIVKNRLFLFFKIQLLCN